MLYLCALARNSGKFCAVLTCFRGVMMLRSVDSRHPSPLGSKLVVVVSGLLVR